MAAVEDCQRSGTRIPILASSAVDCDVMIASRNVQMNCKEAQGCNVRAFVIDTSALEGFCCCLCTLLFVSLVRLCLVGMLFLGPE
eukprot:3523277-Rhodomonas_salina.1